MIYKQALFISVGLASAAASPAWAAMDSGARPAVHVITEDGRDHKCDGPVSSSTNPRTKEKSYTCRSGGAIVSGPATTGGGNAGGRK